MIRRFADRLLRWYCRPEYYPDVSGDLEELYRRNLSNGTRGAGWRYLLQVIALFRPVLLKDFGQMFILKNTGMLINFLKISYRNLMRNKMYTVINVCGLALGLAAFLLIQTYIRFEKGYDRFLPDSQNIYRLTTDQIVNGDTVNRDAMSFNPAGQELQNEFPEIADYTITQKSDALTFGKGESLVSEERVLWVDEHFLEVFQYPISSGERGALLSEPNTIVLTQSKAAFYFGDENAVGKTIHLFSGQDKDFKVVGIIEDVPENTHYGFDILLSISSIKKRLEQDGWNGYNYYVYLKMNQPIAIEAMEKRMVPVMARHMSGENNLYFNLQPVESIHLHSDLTFEPEVHGSARAVKFLQMIGVFILLLAWINYINLSTARAISRAKEVGLRKTIGASKDQIRRQFLLEALLINACGGVLALLLVTFATPYFNYLIGKQVIGFAWSDTHLGLFLLGLVVAGTLLSGFYPALIQSNFSVVTVLKGKFSHSQKGIVLRKGLVVLQFATSLALLIGTFVVAGQVHYMRSKDPGMSLDQVVGFANPGSSGDWQAFLSKVKAFQQELEKSGAVLATSTMTNLPGGGSSDINSMSGGMRVVGLTDRVTRTFYQQSIDYRTLDVLGMELLYGQTFHENPKMDSSNALVNEAFIRSMGLQVSADLLHEKIQGGKNPNNHKYQIIGIVKDVNRTSLKEEVEPTIYYSWDHPSATVVKLPNGRIEEGLKHIESSWAAFFPTEVLDYQFLDERFDRLYEADIRFGKLFGIFSSFAMFVAVLGLLGLSSFMAAQRTKEVGVRKVLGASVAEIVVIFYREFLTLIGVATLIGVPIVFWLMNDWLRGYAYHIDFPWGYVAAAVIVLIGCALLTVGSQVWKIAILNPAATLKDE